MTLQHLDTVIAFAVVMLGASLLITIFTQAMSTLFAHRGSNLRSGLQVLFETVDPSLAAPQAENLAEKVLTHPILSDSMLFRPRNLPVLGWLIRRWRLASAVRVEELIRILPSITKKELPQANQESLKAWFDSAMDRVSQRFVQQMRIWTIVFSIVLAFAAHLDAFRLLRQLSSDAELRARLVSTADTMTKQAASILPSQPGGGSATLSVVPGIYSDQIKYLKTKESVATKNLGDPPSFDSRKAAIQWLRDGMKGDSQTERLVTEYQQLVDAGLETDADKLLDQSADVKDILAKTGFQLIPDPYPQPWYKPWKTFKAREFWGTLAAAGFLSLGAPFWFNALKTLSSLRPVVATKEEEEKEQEQKKNREPPA